MKLFLGFLGASRTCAIIVLSISGFGINANDPDKQVLVTLESGGSMSGIAFDVNGSLLVGSEIEFFNAAGFLSGTALVGFDGFYLVPALPAGSYYGIIRRSDGLGDYLYGGEYCGSGCNILNGPAVVVSQGQDVLNIDFINFIDNVFKSGFEN